MSELDSDLMVATQHELWSELETVERAIARGSTFVRCVDSRGVTRVRVSRELLGLAEREHAIVTELRRRHTYPTEAPWSLDGLGEQVA